MCDQGREGGAEYPPCKKTQDPQNTPRTSPFSPVAAFLLFACHRSPTSHDAHEALASIPSPAGVLLDGRHSETLTLCEAFMTHGANVLAPMVTKMRSGAEHSFMCRFFSSIFSDVVV